MRALALAIGLTLLAATPAAARPPYFDALTARYGFAEGDRLFACGVCHYKWEGTGARNPFGASVQQQLYVGKSSHVDYFLDHDHRGHTTCCWSLSTETQWREAEPGTASTGVAPARPRSARPWNTPATAVSPPCCFVRSRCMVTVARCCWRLSTS